jgi:hypothetical protein
MEFMDLVDIYLILGSYPYWNICIILKCINVKKLYIFAVLKCEDI